MRTAVFSIILPLLLWGLPLVIAASWGFDDSSVSLHGKKAGVGGGAKQKLTEGKALPQPISLGPSDTLKILLTTKNGKTPKRPHQAFLLLKDPTSNLDTSFPLSVKESGKGKVELIELDPASPPPSSPKPLRYGKLPEIHHIFKADPTNPPKIITIVFLVAVLAAVPSLFYMISSANDRIKSYSERIRRTVSSTSATYSSWPNTINLDASDPDFARSLRSLGPVQPSSTLSNSSTFDPSQYSHQQNQYTPQIFPNPALNPALQVISRRNELAREAEAEFAQLQGQGGGRKFLDVARIREILMLRDGKGMSEGEIEKRLGLQKGLVAKLGAKGVVMEAGLGSERDTSPSWMEK
ncbi:MAG: hypothetical protein Q9220_001524 [cf. Caloplaca sp. 1 TL-2023]